MSEYRVIIAPEIKYLLEELSNRLLVTVDFDVEQILEDYKNGQVSSKEYGTTNRFGDLSIKGLVLEYEPETLLLEFRGFKKSGRKIINNILEVYTISFGVGASYRDNSESLILFKQMLE